MSMTMQAPPVTVGELLKISRRRAKLEQVEIAESLGIARNTVSNYETGRSAPSFDVVVRWAQLTDVSLEWLAAGVLPGPAHVYSADEPVVHPPGLEPGTHWLTAYVAAAAVVVSAVRSVRQSAVYARTFMD